MKNDSMQNDDESRQKYVEVTEHVRIFKRGKQWYANYQMNGRQVRTSLKTTSKKQACQKALKIDTELLAGSHQIKKKTASFEEVIDAHYSKCVAEGLTAKTIAKYKTVHQRMLFLQRERKINCISELDVAFLDAYRLRRMKDDAKDKTIHTEITIVRQIVNFALDRNMIEKDPLKGHKLKRPKPTEQPCWSREEVEQILANCDEHYLPLLTLLSETGMRIGEAKHLTWKDIDYKRGQIHIRPKGNWKTKTGDRRVIPMSAKARMALKMLPQSGHWVFNSRKTENYPEPDRQISDRRVLEHLKRVLSKLELEGKVHTFRHAFISNALIDGIPEAIVRKWVGHVDPQILKLYTHIADEASQTAMQRLNELNTKTNLHKNEQERSDET